MMPGSSQGPQSPAHLQALGLCCERGERALFAGLDLALHGGEVTWLRGRNGRGKTTLLRTLAGLSQPAAGRIEWRKAQCGALLYLGHANALKEDLTVAESLTFFARLRSQPADAPSIAAALAALGVAELRSRPVRTLSQGQRRRVALARLALAPAPGGLPAPWLLDEPFDALDDDGVARLVRLVSAHAAAGACVVFTSHQAVPALQPPPREFDLDGLRSSAGAG
jgi:heme exporter protein A